MKNTRIPLTLQTIWLVVVMVFGFFLSSCGASRQSAANARTVQTISNSRRENALDYVRQQEARLDIPFPLALDPIPELCIPNENASESITLGFSTSASAQELVAFYERSMEAWRLINHIKGPEHLMVYTRPGGKVCTISIRPQCDTSATHLVIFVGKKEVVS